MGRLGWWVGGGFRTDAPDAQEATHAFLLEALAGQVGGGEGDTNSVAGRAAERGRGAESGPASGDSGAQGVRRRHARAQACSRAPRGAPPESVLGRGGPHTRMGGGWWCGGWRGRRAVRGTGVQGPGRCPVRAGSAGRHLGACRLSAAASVRQVRGPWPAGIRWIGAIAASQDSLRSATP